MSTDAAERRHEVATSDGVNLNVLVASVDAPRAVLMLCHGLTTDCVEHGAFPALRDRAVRAGLAVVRFDFRGHGRSGGSNEMLRLAGARADADAVAGLVNELLGDELPKIPVGLSFGSAAAVHLAASSRRCAGLVLWYPVVDYQWNYGPGSPVPFTQQMRAAIDPEKDPDWAGLPILGSDYYIPAGLMAELPDDPTPRQLASLPLPVLVYHGSRDPFVDLAPIRQIAADHPNVELRIAHGAGHGFVLWRPLVIMRTVAWAAAQARAAA